MLAYRLACDRPGRFAAIGPVAGTITSDCPAPLPIPVLHIHGLDDRSVTFDGSLSGGVTRQVRTPVPDAVTRFRAAAACDAAMVTTSGPVTTDRAACSRGVEVTLITIVGAGHQWPGGAPRVGAQLGDPPSTALHATETLWAFFAAQRRRT